ncbi:MAG: lasso peptide biosynthesis B2 protein [Sphingomonadaceae bacterium]|nr:lasso peptide biosynthesis B2 protein [Sphingomonadaceae bacterium]
MWRDYSIRACVPNDTFLAALRARKWLRDEAKSNDGGPSVRWLPYLSPRFRAEACIAAARWRLKLQGFATAYRWAESSVVRRTGSAIRLEDDLNRFTRAETWIPSLQGDRDCLPRSFALFVYLRSLGHPVRHVIGVARFPFNAHAWVELEGETLLEHRPAARLLPNARAPRGRTPIAIIG